MRRQLTRAKAQELLNMMRDGYANHEIASLYGIDRRRISELRTGRTFKNLDRTGIPRHQLTRAKAQELLNMMRDGYANHVLAKLYKMDRRRISELRTGKTFRHLDRTGVPQRPYQRITREQAEEIKSWLPFTRSNKLIAAMTQANPNHVAMIRRGRHWR